MNKRQQKLKADIQSQNEKEIQENILYTLTENERHLHSISSSLGWILFIFILSIVIWIATMMMVDTPTGAM